MALPEMIASNHQALRHSFTHYRNNSLLQTHVADVEKLVSTSATENNIDDVVNLYEAAIRTVEKGIRTAQPDTTAVTLYQQLYQELEAVLAQQRDDKRHKFVVVIPVADRPRHLQSCLQSLLTLCRSFHYGGYHKQAFPKLAVIIADDTKDRANIQKHKDISRHFNSQGIETIYFGLEEQRQQLHKLSEDDRKRLVNILGNIDGPVPPHKGPSIMRNITYLKLNELCRADENLLFHFIDSDQEFQVKTHAAGGNNNVYSVNYFYELDRIFTRHDVSILTGKVVGDPPVSPAVMAGTFLDDIITFLHRMAATEPEFTCQFHAQNQQKEYDAAYHDMAELFGFKPTTEAYHYHCSLGGEHDHAACFANFANQLNQFFHGEHPTRKSYFNHDVPVAEPIPARTIYTGNYVLNAAQLKYFIPFAQLKLRMAGPVLGRIIKAECHDRFVSANLPMLHNRTVEDSGKSEFRPGIHNKQESIDLSGEFERQYFGDVMLFSMEKLTAMGYPAQAVSAQTVMKVLEATEKDMRQKYTAKQAQIQQQLALLKSLFFDANHWWHKIKGMDTARDNFVTFITNIDQNFSTTSRSYTLVESDENRTRRFREMHEAILAYPTDRKAWASILEPH